MRPKVKCQSGLASAGEIVEEAGRFGEVIEDARHPAQGRDIARATTQLDQDIAQQDEDEESPNAQPRSGLGLDVGQAQAGVEDGGVVSEEGRVEQVGERAQADDEDRGRQNANLAEALPFSNQPGDDGDAQVGGQIPGIDDGDRAQRQRQKGKEPDAAPCAFGIPFLTKACHQVVAQGQEEHGEGDADHVRVQVGEEIGPEGELVDREGQHARGRPEIVPGQIGLSPDHLANAGRDLHAALQERDVRAKAAAQRVRRSGGRRSGHLRDCP